MATLHVCGLSGYHLCSGSYLRPLAEEIWVDKTLQFLVSALELRGINPEGTLAGRKLEMKFT